MTTLELACAADEAYLPHAAVLMHSAATAGSAPGQLQVHLLHQRLSPSSIATIQRFAAETGFRLAVHEVHDARLEGLQRTQRFPTEMWLRYLVPEVLPESERVLYIDVDAVVLADLGPLWKTDLRGAHIGAVTNVRYRDENGPADPGRYPDGLDLDPDSYFNSGVVLADLEAWRRDGTAAELLATAAEHPELLWPDQSVLNLVLGESRIDLEPRWNATTAMLDLELGSDVFEVSALRRARESPGIRHFEGPDHLKPWHYLCRLSYREAYLEHRRQTPWRRFRPDGRNAGAVWQRVRGRARGLGARRRS